MLNEFELTGRARTHVVRVSEPRFGAHADVVEAFLAMRREAALAGVDLSPYRSFRDFDVQLRIWNDKFSGKRPPLELRCDTFATNDRLTYRSYPRHRNNL